MVSSLKISGDKDLINDLRKALILSGLDALPLARMRTLPGVVEIAVALGSAGAFTAFYKLVANFLARHKDRVIKIERNGYSVSLKGHCLAEEKELLHLLMPDLLQPHSSDHSTIAPKA